MAARCARRPGDIATASVGANVNDAAKGEALDEIALSTLLTASFALDYCFHMMRGSRCLGAASVRYAAATHSASSLERIPARPAHQSRLQERAAHALHSLTAPTSIVVSAHLVRRAPGAR